MPPIRHRRSAPRTLLLTVFAAMLLAAACDQGSETSSGGRRSTTTTVPTTTTNKPTTTTTAPTTTTTAPTTTSTAPITTTTTAPPPAAPEPEVLESGVEGPRTLALQQRLLDLRFDPGPLDGQFGTKTVQAVWAFQHTYGVEATGQVAPDLWAAMQTAGPPEPLVPDGGPNRTEISLDRQALYVYRDGQIALITHISTGTGQHYCDNGSCGTAITPTGNHRWERRISGWRESVLGLLYNPIYFKGGWAVHGSKSVPNHPASHGCVRIPMHIAEYFPDIVSNGDPVYVL
ncbi:MAG: L,D-transpeptidase family protein [Acidimicrobiales bacterium]